MENTITAEEALQKLYELMDSDRPVTQHAIEDIISEISIVDNLASKKMPQYYIQLKIKFMDLCMMLCMIIH